MKQSGYNSYPNLNNTIMELVKTLQNLKINKDVLDHEIGEGEIRREQLIQSLHASMDELEKINESLEQKNSVLNVYNKILDESNSAYSKIVQSTEALYQMVKNEEKKITVKSQY